MKYREGFKYQLFEDEYFPNTKVVPPSVIEARFFELSMSGDMKVLGGYAWDGPSGPTIDSRDALRASLAHDALYQMMREGLLPQWWRSRVDEYFGEILKADGMGSFRRSYWLWAIRRMASGAASPNSRRPVLIAP